MGVDTVKPLRSVRSFVRRQGRLTLGQQRAINDFSSIWLLADEPQEALDFQAVFGNDHPVVLEIGFGDGQCLLQMAQEAPECNFVGVEVHQPGVGRLLQGISDRQLVNVRAFNGDVVEILARRVADAELSGIHIFFPDPWHKKRHHKRRLIQSSFVALLVKKLKQGGIIHLATDWENYAEQMLSVLSGHLELRNQTSSSKGFYENSTARPQTKFEKRGLRLGHGVWDLIFKKM